MCMIDDAEPWTLFTETRPHARKAHRCGECSRTIEVGERYVRGEGLADGDWHTLKTCVQCDAAKAWLLVACDGYIGTMVEEDLRNHVVGDERYLRSRPLTRLVRWMAADWRDRSGKLRELDAVVALTDAAIGAYQSHYDRAVS